MKYSCEFTYLHRADRTGFKAGALNHALRLTPADAELIAVVDADYHVEPEYLKETVGYFIDPGLGFVQTPQDYRNIHQSFLTKQYYFADGYFYRAMLPSRNEVNSTSFCGTMGSRGKSRTMSSHVTAPLRGIRCSIGGKNLCGAPSEYAISKC